MAQGADLLDAGFTEEMALGTVRVDRARLRNKLTPLGLAARGIGPASARECVLRILCVPVLVPVRPVQCCARHQNFFFWSRCVCQSAPVRALVAPACCERGLFILLALEGGRGLLSQDSVLQLGIVSCRIPDRRGSGP